MTIIRILQKRRENMVCVLSPHASITTKEEKSNVGFESPMSILQKRKKNPMCALSPHVGIAIEEKKLICVLAMI
jgi:hypothetical protein